MTDVFIGCGEYGDRELLEKLKSALAEWGFAVCTDTKGQEIDEFVRKVAPAITESTDFVLILSRGVFKNVQRRDDTIRLELETAINRRKNVVAFRTTDFIWDAELPQTLSVIKNCRTVEFTDGDFSESFPSLLSALASTADMDGSEKMHSIVKQ